MPKLRQIDEEIRQVSFNRGLELIKAENRDQVRRDTAEKLAALYAERARMLSERGMSMDDLLPRYACEKCSDTGYLENGELCPCARLKLAGRKYSSSGISENAGFDRFNENIFKDPEQLKRTRRAAEICAQYAENLEIGGAKGLLLMGETGLGKTFLMDSIGREAIRRGYSVKKYTAYNLIDAALRAVRRHEAGPELTGAGVHCPGSMLCAGAAAAGRSRHGADDTGRYDRNAFRRHKRAAVCRQGHGNSHKPYKERAFHPIRRAHILPPVRLPRVRGDNAKGEGFEDVETPSAMPRLLSRWHNPQV